MRKVAIRHDLDLHLARIAYFLPTRSGCREKCIRLRPAYIMPQFLNLWRKKQVHLELRNTNIIYPNPHNFVCWK